MYPSEPAQRGLDLARPQQLSLEELTIRFERASDGAVHVEVPRGPRVARSRRLDLEHSEQIGFVGHSFDGAPHEENRAAQNLGERLFDRLFSAETRVAFVGSRAAVATKERSLRLRLTADAADPTLQSIHSLPWELLYSRETRNFLALDLTTPIVRSLGIPLVLDLDPIEGPVKVAVIVSSPRDLPRLDHREEVKVLQDLQINLGTLVELTIIEDGSLDSLREHLRRNTVHILHFIGHGGFDHDLGSSYLAFVGRNERSVRVPADLLGHHLLLHGRPRLTVLNACNGATISDDESHSPFDSTAAALSLASLPAVIAMQWQIQSLAAVRFSRSFYHALTNGDSIECAITEARLAMTRMRGLMGSILDWSAPALYLHAPDGWLFERADEESTSKDESLEQPEQSAEEEPKQGSMTSTVTSGFITGHGSTVSGTFTIGKE